MKPSGLVLLADSLNDGWGSRIRSLVENGARQPWVIKVQELRMQSLCWRWLKMEWYESITTEVVSVKLKIIVAGFENEFNCKELEQSRGKAVTSKLFPKTSVGIPPVG